MANARKAREIRVAAPNAVGLLAKVCNAVAGAGVDIDAVCGYAVEDKGYIMLITRDNAKAGEALRSAGYEVSGREVVLVDIENRVGAGAEAVSKIAEAGIDIRYCYATASDGKYALTVMATSDDQKALEVL